MIQPKLPNIVYQGIMLSMIIISAVIISFDVNTEKVSHFTAFDINGTAFKYL